MEGKKLNLNQPFLSVRRPLIPYYKPELKSGPVGEKGAVPFHWEQTPGKPREEITTVIIENKARNYDRLQSYAAPMLPPGRYLNPTLRDFRQVSSNNIEIKALNIDNFENFERLNENTEEHGNNNGDDEDGDEDYADALDTLSRTNSTFLNCSMSGVSRLEDSDIKPCRDFTRDPNTLNLVMDRFLPAAKAMVSNKPQYVPKKPMVIQGEESQDLAKKMVIKKEDRDKPSLRYGPSYANRYSIYHVSKEYEEDEDSDYDDDDHGQGGLIPSVCGLLPRFCLKSSSGILNPAPGMSVRTRIAKPHGGNKVRNRSLSNCSNPEIGLKPEVCDIKRVDTTTTVVIEEKENIMSFKSQEKVSKTFAQLLNDEDAPEDLDLGFNGAAEKVLSLDTIRTTENHSVPNEALCARDVVRDQEEHVDFPSKDIKNLDSVDISNNSAATDDVEIDPKKSEISEKKYSEFIISPPLPKSPSDSWLWRTLPSVSANNIYQHSNLGTNGSTRNLNPKVPVGGTMWEAIVKSSKQQHDNSHYPEEILTPLQKT